jgi:hypothetical protein
LLLSKYHGCRQCGPIAAGKNLELPSQLPDPFPHSWDTYPKLRAVRTLSFQDTRRDPVSFIRNGDHGLIRPALQANMSPLASRVAVDVGQPFLHGPVQCQLDIAGQSSAVCRHFQIDTYSGSFGIPVREPPQG